GLLLADRGVHRRDEGNAVQVCHGGRLDRRGGVGGDRSRGRSGRLVTGGFGFGVVTAGGEAESKRNSGDGGDRRAELHGVDSSPDVQTVGSYGLDRLERKSFAASCNPA